MTIDLKQLLCVVSDLRRAKLRALDLFVRVFSKEPYREPWTSEAARQKLREIFAVGNGLCFISETPTTCVGLLFARSFTWCDGQHAFVEDLAVDATFRKRGVATNLVEYLLRAAREQGCTNCDALLHQHAPATEIWQRWGFVTTSYHQHTQSLALVSRREMSDGRYRAREN